MSWIKLGFDAYGVDMVQTRQPDFVQNCAAFQQASEYLYHGTPNFKVTFVTYVCQCAKVMHDRVEDNQEQQIYELPHHFFSLRYYL